MVSRSNSASQALYNLTASSPSASLYDDESQLLAETELDTLGDDGQSPAGVRRRKLTCWPLMAVLDALGLLALAGVAQTTDSSQPITPTAWLAATAVLALVFGNPNPNPNPSPSPSPNPNPNPNPNQVLLTGTTPGGWGHEWFGAYTQRTGSLVDGRFVFAHEVDD